MKFQDTVPIGNKAGGWRKLIQVLERRLVGTDGPGSTRLREVHGFGSNPGNLRMFSYRPQKLAESPALARCVARMHTNRSRLRSWCWMVDTCGSLWLCAALPGTTAFNNPNGCFNWFQAEDSQRDRGEPLSIRQMIEKSIIDHGIDRRRIFVTGLSAGGAMTSIMLACYPDVFAGGAIIAGLPYGAATNVQQAFESMFQSPSTQPLGDSGNRKISASRTDQSFEVEVFPANQAVATIRMLRDHVGSDPCRQSGLGKVPVQLRHVTHVTKPSNSPNYGASAEGHLGD